MSAKRLDVGALYAALDLIRSHGDMSWREVAKQTGCSPSTFSRLAEGRRPDADALCTLVAWLRVPLGRFTIDAREDSWTAEELDAAKERARDKAAEFQELID